MKKSILVVATILFAVSASQAQGGLKGLINKVTKKDTTANKSSVIDKIKGAAGSSATGSGLSSDQIVAGLKEALRVGTDSTAKKLGSVNGFFGNAIIKIIMPPEAQKVEAKLRMLGMGKLVDNAILSMNRAAEDAAKGVGTIFWNAIKSTDNVLHDGLNRVGVSALEIDGIKYIINVWVVPSDFLIVKLALHNKIINALANAGAKLPGT